MVGFIPKRLYRGCHHLSSAHATNCAVIGTYYKVDGTWSDGDICNNGFIFDGTGKITYIGESGAILLFNGVSDVKADKVSQVHYGLYLNGSIVPGAETPVDFVSANSLRNISISNFVPLQKGDYFEIYIKSDTTNTLVTSNTLFLTFLGDA